MGGARRGRGKTIQMVRSLVSLALAAAQFLAVDYGNEFSSLFFRVGGWVDKVGGLG